jgi:hypothetical protein
MRFEPWLIVLVCLNVVCGGVVKAPGDAYSVPDQNVREAHNVPDQNIQGL